MKRTEETEFARPHPLLLGLFLGLALGANVASAATPRAKFDSALVTGSTDRISVTRVPVVDSAGKTAYKDVTIDFEVDEAGTLMLAPFSPTIEAAPSLVTSGFKAGNYKDTRGNTYKLAGPSVVPGTTRTMWSLSLAVATSDASFFSMNWTTGPIAGHPNQSSLTARNITSTAFSWGIVGDGHAAISYFPFYGWNYGEVVGAAQVGNQLVLHLFENLDNIEDSNVSLTQY